MFRYPLFYLGLIMLTAGILSFSDAAMILIPLGGVVLLYVIYKEKKRRGIFQELGYATDPVVSFRGLKKNY